MYGPCAMWAATWAYEVVLQRASACNEYVSRDLVSQYKMSVLTVTCWNCVSSAEVG